MMKHDGKPIPIEQFGKDHWSTFAYIETRTVDYKGVPDRDHMRCDPDIHPGLANRANASSPDARYPTKLRGYFNRLNGGTDTSKLLSGHDDWSCAEDLEKAGLLKWEGTGIHPVFVLTDLGRKVATQLREFKAKGGSFAFFVPVLG